MNAIEHNSHLITELKEHVKNHDMGLYTDVELLAKSLEICAKMEWPEKGTVDLNTGLSHQQDKPT